jgi:hypothetical protein
MNLFRRILTGATLLTAFVPLSQATVIISYGFDSSTGNYTVTQTASLGTTTLNVSSPTSLFSFGSFGSLGIAGATYASGDSTFDYEFTNSVTAFQVTNNDTVNSSDQVNASVQSLLNVDSGTTLTNPNRKTVGQGLGFSFSGFTPAQQTVTAISTPGGGVTILSGQTYTYPTLPSSVTQGIGYDAINLLTSNPCSSFGDVSTTDGCNSGISDANAGAGFAYGLTDTQQFADSLVGGGLLNLTIVATTTYTAEAEVTYEYTVPSGTPEPGTMVLLGSALVGLGIIGKRRRRA